MHFRIHRNDKYRELKTTLVPSAESLSKEGPFMKDRRKSSLETEVCARKSSGFANAICSWDFIIPGCKLSFPGGKKKNLMTEGFGLRAGMCPFTI